MYLKQDFNLNLIFGKIRSTVVTLLANIIRSRAEEGGNYRYFAYIDVEYFRVKQVANIAECEGLKFRNDNLCIHFSWLIQTVVFRKLMAFM